MYIHIIHTTETIEVPFQQNALKTDLDNENVRISQRSFANLFHLQPLDHTRIKQIVNK